MHLHETVNIEGLKDSVEITARVSEGLKAKYGEAYTDNLYKIELTGEIPLDAEILTAEIESRLGELVYYAKVKDSTEYTADFGALAEETSLKGIFVKKMLEKIDSASPEERELYKKALKLGLKAFVSEVKYLED